MGSIINKIVFMPQLKVHEQDSENDIFLPTSHGSQIQVKTIIKNENSMSIFNFKRPTWIPRWLNIPLLIFVGFVVVLLFFGDNNYMRINKYRSQINDLKSQIKNNEDSAAMYEAKVNELNTDKESLERLVREKYGMKRVNEEVFITDIP